MKIALAPIVLAATMMTAPAFAQTKNFEGFNAGLVLTGTTSKVDAGITAAPNTYLSGASSTSSTNLDVQVSYSFSITPKFAIGLGSTIGFGPNTAGTAKIGGNTVEIGTKERVSFDLLPSLALNDSTLMYLKLSSLTAKGTVNVNGVGVTDSLSGFGYGIGAKYLLNPSMYLQAGYDVNTYKENNTLTNGRYNLGSETFYVGVGYRF